MTLADQDVLHSQTQRDRASYLGTLAQGSHSTIPQESRRLPGYRPGNGTGRVGMTGQGELHMPGNLDIVQKPRPVRETKRAGGGGPDYDFSLLDPTFDPT